MSSTTIPEMAHTRAGSPQTSYEAAETVDVNRCKRLTLKALAHLKETPDYPAEEWRVKDEAEKIIGGLIADSTIRSRLKDLTRDGLVIEADREGRSRQDNRCTRYQLAEMEEAA